MNFKKIISAVAAAAVAVTTMAVSAFAIDLDSEYVGDWGRTAGIAKTEFDKFEGDVKVVLTVEAVNVKDGNSYILKPMNVDKSWDAITSSLTAEKAVAKPDGFMQIRYDQTELEFVVPKEVKDELWDGGLAFQVNNVIVKSAVLSDGAPENPLTIVTDADTVAYCAGTFDPWAVAEEAPAEDEATADAEEAEDTADETDVAEDDAADEADVAEDDAADEADVAEDDAADEADEVDVAEDTAEDVEDDAADEVAVDNTAVDTTADSTTTPVQTGNVSAAVILSVMAVAGAAAVAAKRK